MVWTQGNAETHFSCFCSIFASSPGHITLPDAAWRSLTLALPSVFHLECAPCPVLVHPETPALISWPSVIVPWSTRSSETSPPSSPITSLGLPIAPSCALSPYLPNPGATLFTWDPWGAGLRFKWPLDRLYLGSDLHEWILNKCFLEKKAGLSF